VGITRESGGQGWGDLSSVGDYAKYIGDVMVAMAFVLMLIVLISSVGVINREMYSNIIPPDINEKLNDLYSLYSELGYNLSTFQQYANPLLDWVSKINITGEASYIVFTDGSRYYVKNGSTGMIEYSDADATNVIQYSINKVIAMGGGTVLLREGKYYLSNTISIQNAVGVELRGLGMGKTVLMPNTDDPGWAPVILVNNSNYIKLTGFTIDQRRTKVASLPDVVFIVNSNYVEVSYLEITRYYPFALSFGRPIAFLTNPSKAETPPFSPSSNIYVHHNFIHDSVQACGGDGIHLYATKNAVITDNILVNTGDDSISVGGMKDYVSWNYIIANNIVGSSACGSGIKLHTIYKQPPGNYPIRNVVISNNVGIPNLDSGIILSWESNQTTDFPMYRIVVIGNRVSWIIISGVLDLLVAGNRFDGGLGISPGASLYFVEPQPSKFIYMFYNVMGKVTISSDLNNKGVRHGSIFIKGNYFGGSDKGVYIIGNLDVISHVFIEDNVFQTDYGVHVEGSCGVDTMYIVRNMFFTSTYDLYLVNYYQDKVYIYDNYFSKPIYDAPNRAHYSRNRGYLTENSGVATIPAGSTRVTVSHGLAKAPTKVLITPFGNARVWVENITPTTFDIVTDTAPTTNLNVAWYAES